MNRISWIIYFSDISDNIRDALIGFGIISVLIGFICAAILVHSVNDKDWEKNNDEVQQKRRIVNRLFYWGVPLVIIMFIFSALLPNRQTVLMIAASEAAEKALTSDNANKIMDTLAKAINDQVKK